MSNFIDILPRSLTRDSSHPKTRFKEGSVLELRLPTATEYYYCTPMIKNLPLIHPVARAESLLRA
ncbi:MAG: hypothetical protein ACOC3E_00150 [Cyanobacteriota bacterium]